MEKLDLNNFHGNFSDFLTLFKEYKNSFSQKAPIHLPKPKNSAVEFHLQRIQNWLNLNKYFGSHNQTPPESIFNELNSIFDTCVPYIEHSFENEPFHLGHNHFSYSELHSTPQNKSPYTLTDFGHLGWKPESYELAFIIWHEFLLSKLKNKEFQSVTQSTMEGIEESFKVGLYEKSKHTIYAALLERALGTLFADVWSSNPSESIEIKLAKHNAVKLLIEELLNQLGH